MISGESGAVPLGVVFEVMTNPEYQVIRQEINLDKDANILLISTEGDTDPINYRKIVWE